MDWVSVLAIGGLCGAWAGVIIAVIDYRMSGLGVQWKGLGWLCIVLVR
jgi:hypothetical protein